jgi:uncharacterized tellurite resistance protein B-like protein
MDKNIAKTRLLDLYKIAISDGKIDKNEYRFIIDIAKSIGLNSNEALDIINKNIDFKITPPQSINERMQHLFQMLFLIKIDGEIHTKEINIIKNTALYLGLNLSMTDELIEVIKNYKKELVPKEEMIRIVKQHMN